MKIGSTGYNYYEPIVHREMPVIMHTNIGEAYKEKRLREKLM